MSRLPSCAVLVLNWNGIEHLRWLLPTLEVARDRCPAPVSLVVVDNRSTEPDVEWVRAHHPTVETIVAERNDYLYSLNRIVAARAEDVVVILNNDMRAAPDFIVPLLAHFEAPDVFAVESLVYDWDGSGVQIGPRSLELRKFWPYFPQRAAGAGPQHTIEAGGGCSAFRRSHFVALGGFDRLYHPAYLEDLDLSYRAWLRGWRTVLEPRSVLYHRGGATLGATEEARARVRALKVRNEVLFAVKNLGGPAYLAGFLALLPFRIAARLARGDFASAAGILAAARRLGAALRARAARDGADRGAVARLASAIGSAPPGARSAA